MNRVDLTETQLDALQREEPGLPVISIRGDFVETRIYHVGTGAVILVVSATDQVYQADGDVPLGERYDDVPGGGDRMLPADVLTELALRAVALTAEWNEQAWRCARNREQPFSPLAEACVAILLAPYGG